MPRMHIYLKNKTLDGIRLLVEEQLKEGATTSESNMSSVSAELLEIGLRVKSMKKEGLDKEKTQDDIYREILIEQVVKAGLAAEQIIKLFYSLQELKIDPRYDYGELTIMLKEKKEGMVMKALGK